MKRKIKNLKEFKALIKRYETMTIEEMNGVFDQFTIESPAQYLTGFSSCRTCTLCTAIFPPLHGNRTNGGVDCYKYACVYALSPKDVNEDAIPPCCSGELKLSYDMIDNAEDEQSLFLAYRNRAAAMREFAKKHNIKL